MRLASWGFVLCAVLIVAGVFAPCLDLRPGGTSLSRRTRVSLYRIASDRALARRLLAAYRGSSRREIGGKTVRAVAPWLAGRSRTAAEDVRDALDTLDDLSDDDVRWAGAAFTDALIALVALDAAMALIVFAALMREREGRGSRIAALVAAALVALLALALHLVCREAVWQANDEVGFATLALGPGAYLLPLAAIAALAIAIGKVRAAPRHS